ncbi:MAG: hypothetical protein BZ133_00275, partial [Methanosphaera sp. SHI613]
MQLHNKYVLNSEFKDIMINNKTKLFLLFTVIFVAMIGISSISAADADSDVVSVEDTSNNIADVPTVSDDNIDNSINNDVQTTSDINSNVNNNSKEVKKTVEKEDKNVKGVYGDYSLSVQYPTSITSGSNLKVDYSVDGNIDDDDLFIIGMNLNYLDSTGRQKTLQTGFEEPYGAAGLPIEHPMTGTYTFTNVRPVSGAQSYYVGLFAYSENSGADGYLQPNDAPFTFSDVAVEPVNVKVDSVSFATINDKVYPTISTDVTVVLSNNGSACREANVTLTVDGTSQTKKVTNLGSSPKSLVYQHTFSTEGNKDVSVIVDYLNGTSFTAYTGNVMVSPLTQDERANVTVNSVSYTKKQNKVITETSTKVTVVVGNNGVLSCDEADVTLTIGDESQTKTITNLNRLSTQNLVYDYYFKSPGTKTVKVVVDYLNGTTVEAYSGNVKVEIYYTTVSSELLTTKATGTVTGGLYHNAIQNPSFDSSLGRKFQSDVTFNFADDYSNVTTARLYAVLYDSRDEHPTYSFNLTIDGNNDGDYESTIENNHYIGVATTPDSTVYKINDNITKVYTDYVLFYDVTDYINSNTVNVELNSSYGAIKCIGLIVAYNQDNSGKEVKYWINLGTVWSNSDVSTTFATNNYQADDINLTQSIASSSNPTTTFNGNTLTYTKNPSGYFGIESWNVTDKYSSSSNMVLKNTASGSFKTMAATLALTSTLPTNVEVDSVTFTKTQDAVLIYNDTNVTVVVRNNGVVCEEADVTLTIGDESQTKTVTNIGNIPQTVVFEEYFTNAGLKDVSVVITYSNGTAVTAYTGNVNIIASGYMGKSFSQGTNMTVRPIYDGYNTLNVFGHMYGYKSNQPATFTFDANSKGLEDKNKVVDILYYQPWGTWNGLNANVELSVNGKTIEAISSYTDQKGFGSYDYPYGLTVYNLTDEIVYEGVNNFTVTPIRDSGIAYIYGGYILAIYANNTNRTVISIAEDMDALTANTSSSYGATSDTAITYANHNGIDTEGVSSAYVIATANNAGPSDNNVLLVNGVNYGNMGSAYNGNSQVSIYNVNVTEDILENNVISVQCIQDTSVYVLSSILVVTYEEPVQEPNVVVDSVSFT